MSNHQLNASTRVLVTGVTGLIGGEVIRQLVAAGVQKIWALVRPTADNDVEQRLIDRMRRSGDIGETYLQQVEVVSGDVLCPRWNLAPADFAHITKSVDMIIHCAADTSFIRSSSVLTTNVAGTINLIELAECCKRQPLIVYMSTATNVGKVSNCVVSEENGCQPDNDHHNEYTRSKAVAERMLRETELNVLTLRPTIVFSNGIPDSTFARSILWFMPLLDKFDCLPIDPTSRIDIVPVSFVVDGAIKLLKCENRRHDIYHLSAGERHAITMERAFRIAEHYYGHATPLEMIPPAQWTRTVSREYVSTPEQRKIFFGLRYYLPFWNMNVVYDNTRLYETVGKRSLNYLPVEEYADDLLEQITVDEALTEVARP